MSDCFRSASKFNWHNAIAISTTKYSSIARAKSCDRLCERCAFLLFLCSFLRFYFFGVSITFLPYDEIHIAIAAIRFHSLSRAASWPVQFIVVVAVAVCHLRIWFLLRQTFLQPGFLSQVDCCCYWKLWNHHVMIILPLWFAIVFAFVFVFFFAI